eukprot:TRINITY_DN23821_c1_g1_i1.p1 TRINITY_DN23821_c1_g1~~TRINITY_DN23821_c1_g1_i1.p1  ORF type:complete len:899 (+),score=262.10 TRINITY_DN23821_c1_g1_i1:146-2698(+)
MSLHSAAGSSVGYDSVSGGADEGQRGSYSPWQHNEIEEEDDAFALSSPASIPVCSSFPTSPLPHTDPSGTATVWRIVSREGHGRSAVTFIDCAGFGSLFSAGGLLSLQLSALEADLIITDSEDRVSDPLYTFSFGNYQGHRSFVQRRDRGPIAQARHASALLSSEHFTQLWINVHRSGERLTVHCGHGAPSPATAILAFEEEDAPAAAPVLALTSYRGQLTVRDLRVGQCPLPPEELGAPCGAAEPGEAQCPALPGTVRDCMDCEAQCAGGALRCSALVLAATSDEARRRLRGGQAGWELPLLEIPVSDFAEWYTAVAQGCEPPRGGAAGSVATALLGPRGSGRTGPDQLRNLRRLQQQGELTDFQLELQTDCGPRCVAAHSAVLQRFGYFAALMDSGCSEAQQRAASFDLRTGSGGTAPADAFAAALYAGAGAEETAFLRDAVGHCSADELLALLCAAHACGMQHALSVCDDALANAIAAGYLSGVPALCDAANLAESLRLPHTRQSALSALRDKSTTVTCHEELRRLAGLPSSCLCELLRDDAGLCGLSEDVLLIIAAVHVQGRGLLDPPPTSTKSAWLGEVAESLRGAHVSPALAEYLLASEPPVLKGRMVRTFVAQYQPLRDVLARVTVSAGAIADPASRREAVVSERVSVPPDAHLRRARSGPQGSASITVLTPNPSGEGVFSELRNAHSGVNLAKAGVVNVTSSSAKNPLSRGSNLFASRGHTAIAAFPTRLSADPYVELDLGRQRLVPTHYELTHDATDDDYLRSWDFLGWDDESQQWRALDAQKDSRDIAAPNSSAVFGVGGAADQRSYSRFRVAMRGPNSGGRSQLTLGRMELYGTLTQAP